VLVAAAVCPHPPLLVPELASDAAGELDPLRAACAEAVGSLVASGAPVHVVGAAGPDDVRSTSMRPWGVDVPIADEPLPLPLLIGDWLLAGCGARPVARHEIARDAAPADCVALGGRIAGTADAALLVMGDASARRSEKAPGWVDARAEPYDAAVVEALRSGDPAALLHLDAALGAELLAGGRAAWHVLAGAAAGGRFETEIGYDAAPYGVGYLVARWRRGNEGWR
jgi:hypothetical protein